MLWLKVKVLPSHANMQQRRRTKTLCPLCSLTLTPGRDGGTLHALLKRIQNVTGKNKRERKKQRRNTMKPMSGCDWHCCCIQDNNHRHHQTHRGDCDVPREKKQPTRWVTEVVTIYCDDHSGSAFFFLFSLYFPWNAVSVVSEDGAIAARQHNINTHQKSHVK